MKLKIIKKITISLEINTSTAHVLHSFRRLVLLFKTFPIPPKGSCNDNYRVMVKISSSYHISLKREDKQNLTLPPSLVNVALD